MIYLYLNDAPRSSAARSIIYRTFLKKKMKNKLMPLFEKILLRKRSIIETVFSVLKGAFEIEHTRHRSIWNAFVHILSALIAYCMKPNKPAISQN
ncbi:transposase [Rickettsia endosymbiont of Urophora cardui]|uniref:transposase n=1 Tax=Rickettsia endosymbiont of Urophora cardui TaxID=3066265 RepID=UPI00313B3974